MASDATIYSMIQQPKPLPGPMDQYTQMLQVKHLLDSGEMSDLQRQQLRKSIAEDDATSEAYKAGGGDPARVRDLLYGKGLYKPAQAMEKTIQERTKSNAELLKHDDDLVKSYQAQAKEQLKGVTNQQQWDALRDIQMQRAGMLSTPQYRDTAVKHIQQMPAQYDPQWIQRALAKTEGMQDPQPKPFNIGGQTVFRETNPYAPGGANTSPLQHTQSPESIATNETTRRGQDKPIWDSERGVFVQQPDMGSMGRRQAPPPIGSQDVHSNVVANDVPTSPATPAPATVGSIYSDAQARAAAPGPRVISPSNLPPKDKALTEQQGNATGFGMRAAESHRILSELEGEGITNTGILRSTLSGAAGLTPFIGEKLDSAVHSGMNALPTYAGGPSDKQQRTDQARRDFVNAVLRKESGANINKDEFENAAKQYFPQPGDSKTNIEQKQRNREMTIRSLSVQAGPGAKNIPQPAARPKQPAGVDVKKLSDSELMRELGI